MAAPVIQFKRGVFANLPGLQAGEPALTTDTFELYVGIDSTTNGNKFFGSHRYWTKNTTTTGSGVNFVEGTSNGTDFITLKAPNTLSGITTFVLPGADGTNGQILTTNGSGTLSFSSPASSSFTIAGGIGTDTFNTNETLTFAGTASEIETAVTNNQVQIGLPDSVTVTTALTTPTVNATNIKANDGTTAITITNSTGVVATNSDLTVGGNLYVNGSTTQVNTAALTVEDRTIELGVVNGAAPASATTWDLGVLFNYHASTAKKSAVIWEQGDARFKFASVLAADSDGSNVNTPQLTVTTFAPIEIASLFVNDCAGASQVISCTGTTRNLENITIDAGTF